MPPSRGCTQVALTRHPALRALPISVLLASLAAAFVARRTTREVPLSVPAKVVDATARSGGVGPSLPGIGRPFPSAMAAIAVGTPMMHGGPARTHRARGVGPKVLKVEWVAKLPGALVSQVTTSPDEGTLYAASLDGTLTALTRAGSRAWSAPLGDRAYGSPAVAPNGAIYVGSDAKRLFAFKPDGSLTFKLDLEGEVDTSPLVMDDGTIVVAAGTDVVAVRPRGDVLWRYRAKGKVFTSPALTRDRTVVVGSQDDRVYAIRAGELVWSADVGADCDGSPAVFDDGSVVVGTDAGEVIRLSYEGKILSRVKVGGFVRGSLSIGRAGDVLTGTYGPVPRMLRVGTDAVVGAQTFQGTGAREFGIHGGPLEDDEGTLFFGTQDDAVYAYGSDGKRLWSYPTKGDVDAPLTLLSDGHLVVPSEDGTVTLLSP